MSSFNVENFSYDYAHKCYIEYASGNVGAADSMYEKGKEVAESPKWLAQVTKWQTEDVTLYDMEEETLDENSAKSQGANLGGSIALTAGAPAAEFGAHMGASALINNVDKLAQSANSGTIAAALIYSIFAGIFLGTTIKMYADSNKARKEQETYMNTAQEIMKYDYAAKLAELDELNNEIGAMTSHAAQLTKAANVDATVANTAGEATEVSNNELSVAAKSAADEGVSKIITDVEKSGSDILSKLPEIDAIYEQISARQEALTKVKEEIPAFKKERNQQLATMSVLLGGATLSLAAGAVGLAMSWLNYVAAPAAMALFIAGMAMYATSMGLSIAEIAGQNKSKKKLLGEDTENVDKGLKAATDAQTKAITLQQSTKTRETAVAKMGQDIREEDANVNVSMQSAGKEAA